MPGTGQSGYAGFSDQINNHYLAPFETAALMSLISASQMVGLMAAFGGSGTYGLYGYYQPNQTMGGEMAGSSASGQFGGLGQQMFRNGLKGPTHDRNTARLPVQRDGNSGPRVPGSIRQRYQHSKRRRGRWEY